MKKIPTLVLLAAVGVLAFSAVRVSTEQSNKQHGGGSSSSSSSSNVIRLRSYRSKGVNYWTSFDVEEWMNFTVGYPEYSAIVRAHVVDGPTLLAMSADDLLDSFGLEHPLHFTKLKAHLSIVKGQCLCTSKAGTDFWSYKSEHPDNVFVIGSMLAFTPRLGMQYLYWARHDLLADLLAPKVLLEENIIDFPPLVDNEVSYSSSRKKKRGEEGEKDLVDVEGNQAALSSDNSEEDDTTSLLAGLRQIPWFSNIFFLLSSIIFPRIWIMVQLGYFFTSNWIVVPLLWCPLLAGQIGDTLIFLGIIATLRGKGGQREDGKPETVVDILKESFNKIHFAIPFLCFPLSYVLPYLVQDLLILAFFAFSCLVAVGVFQHTFAFLRDLFTGGKKDGDQGGEAPPS